MNTTPARSLTSALGPIRFNAWYETIIDLRIANPEMSQRQMAMTLGKSESWLSLVINSDAFKAQYEKRRAEHSKRIGDLAESRLHQVATKALDRLAETLDKKELKPEFVLDATDTLFARLGYGGKQPNVAPAAPPQQNGVVIQVIAPVSAPTLRQAQATIRAAEQTRLEDRPVRAIPHEMPPIDPDAEELEVVSETPDETILRDDGAGAEESVPAAA